MSAADRPRAVAAFAPAKINLFLHVTGRRPDGYHELDSLIAFADLGDRIAAAPAAELSLEIGGRFAEGLRYEADNLVLRAARLLTERAGVAAGAAITLEKNLPVASGIGGGSADAAATLRALDRLWSLGMAPAELSAVGLSLGADVPVCLFGRAARVSGIGDVIAPAPHLPPLGLLLVNPGVAVPTPAVFAARQGAFSGAVPPLPGFADAASLVASLGATRNDLTVPALSVAPVIGRVLDAISACEGCLLVRLSGSGATCFGLFGDTGGAEAAARAIAVREQGWWVAASRFLDATPAPEPAAD